MQRGLSTDSGRRRWFTALAVVTRGHELMLKVALGVILVALPAAWTFAGSRSRDQYIWKSVTIGGGGFVAGIVTVPTAPGLIYARTDVGGAYRWDAQTKAWIAITDWVTRSDANLMGCESIAVDPSDPNRVYMALGTYTNSWAGNGAIVRSRDQGRTFERTDVPFKMGGNCPGRSVGERLAVDPNDGRILFLGSRAAGLWKSADQAKTWVKVDSFPDVATSSDAMTPGSKEWALGICFVKFDPSTGRHGSATPVIYAGVCTQQTSMFRSIDGGRSWSPVPNQPVGFRPNHMVISAAGLCYISYSDQAGPNEILDGAIWELNPQTDQWRDITPLKPVGYDRFGYGAVTVDAQHPRTLMACSMDRWNKGDAVFRSINGGATWTSQTVGRNYDASVFDSTQAPWTKTMRPHWLGDIEIDPCDSSHVLFVTGYGIWATHDAGRLDSGGSPHWAFEDRGLEETVPKELVSPPRGAHLISVIADFDGFTHDDLDASPLRGRHEPSIGSTVGLDFAGEMPNRVVRAGGRGRGFYSDDGGESWTAFAAKPQDTSVEGPIAISSSGQTILWACGASVISRSTDLGRSWTDCAGLPRGVKPVADRVDPNRFYGFDAKSGRMFVSDDGGANFMTTAEGLPHDYRSLRAVPGHAGDLWLIAGKQLFHSTNAGRAFTPIRSVSSADLVGFGKPGPGKTYPAVFISGSVNRVDGLYRSDDTAGSWVHINDAQHNYGYLDVLIGDPRVYGRVYVGTGGRGIIYGDLPGSSR